MNATLPVTLDLLRLVEETRRAMVAEERKPLAKRDPRPAIRLYAMVEALGGMLLDAGIEVDRDDPGDVLHELAALLGEAARDNPAAALRALAEANQPKSTR